MILLPSNASIQRKFVSGRFVMCCNVLYNATVFPHSFNPNPDVMQPRTKKLRAKKDKKTCRKTLKAFGPLDGPARHCSIVLVNHSGLVEWHEQYHDRPLDDLCQARPDRKTSHPHSLVNPAKSPSFKTTCPIRSWQTMPSSPSTSCSFWTPASPVRTAAVHGSRTGSLIVGGLSHLMMRT